MASPSPPVECVVAEHSEALPTDPTESADATAELHSEYGFIPEKAQSEKFEHREAGLDHADDRQPEKELPTPAKPFPCAKLSPTVGRLAYSTLDVLQLSWSLGLAGHFKHTIRPLLGL
jgi:hypothetical protein